MDVVYGYQDVYSNERSGQANFTSKTYHNTIGYIGDWRKVRLLDGLQSRQSVQTVLDAKTSFVGSNH